jgi:hypothetical protein
VLRFRNDDQVARDVIIILRTREIGFVNGLSSPDASLVGIDFRVQDGQLYGVGDGGGIYSGSHSITM